MGYKGKMLLAVAFFLLLLLVSRDGLRFQPVPAFLFADPEEVLIELGSGFCPGGVRQFVDDELMNGAIKLTTCRVDDQVLVSSENNLIFVSGEHLEIIEEVSGKRRLVRTWMPAAQRIGLGVKLHPDRMTLEDWQDLPGVGPILASRIVVDRQNNGDFDTLEQLQRVDGIGLGQIDRLEKFFH